MGRRASGRGPLRRDEHPADLAFRLLQLLGGRGALRLRVLGDPQAVLDRRHERGVRLLHRLDVEHAAFELGARLQVALAQPLGVGGQQLVGQVGRLLQRPAGLAHVLDGERLGELLAPQRHGVGDDALDLGGERLVVLLDQPDRGQRLHRHLPRQPQVVHAPLQLVARRAQVAQPLRGDRVAALHLARHRRDGLAVHALQHRVAGRDVVAERVEPFERGAVQPLQLLDVLEQPGAVGVEPVADLLDLALDGLVALQDLRGLGAGAVEERGRRGRAWRPGRSCRSRASVPSRVERVAPASPASRLRAPSSMASAAAVARLWASAPKRRTLPGSAMSICVASRSISGSRSAGGGASIAALSDASVASARRDGARSVAGASVQALAHR